MVVLQVVLSDIHMESIGRKKMKRFALLFSGQKSIKVINYYTDEEITIPLDETLTPLENANKYFNKYNKLKRTYEASLTLVRESKERLLELLSLNIIFFRRSFDCS